VFVAVLVASSRPLSPASVCSRLAVRGGLDSPPLCSQAMQLFVVTAAPGAEVEVREFKRGEANTNTTGVAEGVPQTTTLSHFV
jgi:hypothetical protein